MTEMKRSWLVQRLHKPHGPSSIFGKDNPFSFGGGLRNGGLSEDAMSLLRPILSFDYMGAAEFEFGAVPEALSLLAKTASKKRGLVASSVVVLLKDVPASWRAPKNEPAPDGVARIYYLAPREWADEVASRIAAWATGSGGDTKERLALTDTLRPYSEWDGETVGWLEISNGFMFFTDREMWEQTCDLFGVDRERVSA